MAKNKSIIVTIDDDGLKHIDDVASQLTSRGMNVDRVLRMSGVISGTASSDKLTALKNVDGVLGVEEEIGVQIPSPDAQVQ
jgi:hypothetical protein